MTYEEKKKKLKEVIISWEEYNKLKPSEREEYQEKIKSVFQTMKNSELMDIRENAKNGGIDYFWDNDTLVKMWFEVADKRGWPYKVMIDDNDKAVDYLTKKVKFLERMLLKIMEGEKIIMDFEEYYKLKKEVEK